MNIDIIESNNTETLNGSQANGEFDLKFKVTNRVEHKTNNLNWNDIVTRPICQDVLKSQTEIYNVTTNVDRVIYLLF